MQSSLIPDFQINHHPYNVQPPRRHGGNGFRSSKPFHGFPKMETESTTLFVGDLSVLCDEKAVFELFCEFGEIERVQLKKSDRDPQRAHLGFGFVKFASRVCAERALEELNGHFFLGRALRVGWADDFGKPQQSAHVPKSEDPKKKRLTAQIHVTFVTRDLNRRVSELDLGQVFSRFGNLVDIAVKKNAINEEFGVQSGYAFLHFSLTPEGLKSAVAAVEEVNDCMIDNIAYQCKAGSTLSTQLAVMHSLERHQPFTPAHSHAERVAPNFPPTAEARAPLRHLVHAHHTNEARSFSGPHHALSFSTYGNSSEFNSMKGLDRSNQPSYCDDMRSMSNVHHRYLPPSVFHQKEEQIQFHLRSIESDLLSSSSSSAPSNFHDFPSYTSTNEMKMIDENSLSSSSYY
mmetsp:Transcript_17181/g.18641  ORF Transcript_17181/g.18641 Transcript_17181/m.18641 type:complete len:403 (-) Transcript_17181:513-1721(-)